jgi:hypothetical protein
MSRVGSGSGYGAGRVFGSAQRSIIWSRRPTCTDFRNSRREVAMNTKEKSKSAFTAWEGKEDGSLRRDRRITAKTHDTGRRDPSDSRRPFVRVCPGTGVKVAIMRIPDFFIVGAPKCGTTSLAYWLAQHTGIFMPPIKEPHYWSFDLPKYRQVHTEETYRWLFRNAREDQVCGDGSTSYLYSKVAVPRILDVNPAAKFIVMVRNPVSMVTSLHAQKLYSLEETEADFGAAWRLSWARARGLKVHPKCKAPQLLDYRSAGHLGAHLERLLRVVPRENVHVVVFDDIRKDPRMVYEQAARFLGLNPANDADLSTKNQRKKRASGVVTTIIGSAPVQIIKRAAKQTFPGITTTLGKAIHILNSTPAEKIEVAPTIKAEMVREFRGDVALLGRLIDRDLGHWVT